MKKTEVEVGAAEEAVAPAVKRRKKRIARKSRGQPSAVVITPEPALATCNCAGNCAAKLDGGPYILQSATFEVGGTKVMISKTAYNGDALQIVKAGGGMTVVPHSDGVIIIK